MDAAALPGRPAQHGADCLLQALVRVGDDQPDALQAALDEAPHKRRPEGAILRRADVDAEDLTVPLLVTPSATTVAWLTTRPSIRTLWYVASTQR